MIRRCIIIIVTYVPYLYDGFERSLPSQPQSEQAQMLVMPDVEEPFVPLGSDGLFVDPYESKYETAHIP